MQAVYPSDSVTGGDRAPLRCGADGSPDRLPPPEPRRQAFESAPVGDANLPRTAASLPRTSVGLTRSLI